METPIVLSVRKLSIDFGTDTRVVDNVSFEIRKGETLAVVGESGSGKSLTALSVIGLLPDNAIQSGVLSIESEEQSIKLDKGAQWGQLRGKTIGMVFQEPMSSLNPVMPVGQQIAEAITLHQGVGKRIAKEHAIAWLKKVKLPDAEHIYARYPHELSGGQKQRVMIAMAMCNDPVLLIADEPTTALDVTVQKDIIALMKDLQREEGTAMIFITHDLAIAAQIADNVLVMRGGRVVEYGDVTNVLKHPKAVYTQALLECRPSAERKGQRLPVVADVIAGNEVEPAKCGTSSVANEENILTISNLKVWFDTSSDWLGNPTGYYKAVDGVSFELKKGEVLGLVGESGCGKSTISKSLMGLLPVYEGQVLFKDKDLSGLNEKQWRRIRKEIQMIFQDPFASLDPRMSIGDMLLEPLLVHNIVPRVEHMSEVRRLLDIVQLPADSIRRYPHQFSGGQRQRLGIARALAVRPELLICDESVSALDVSVQAQILNLLKDLQTEYNLSYLFISHDLNVVHYISDRVMVMQTGKIVECGNAEQVMQNPVNDYTRKLIAAMP